MRVAGIGIQDFEKVRRGNQFYVDKTDFIAAWYRGNDDVTLITRPRRFGKTLTMDMLDCFFSTVHAGRADLFAGLAISQDAEMMELQGTVPTIWLSFSSVKADSFYGFLLAITGRIGRLLGHYRHLLQGDVLTQEEKELFQEMAKPIPEIPDREREEEKYQAFLFKLTHILQFLSRWLQAYHGKKPFILLDEYDTPIQAAYLNHYYDDAISIMREMFSETFKENEFLDRAVIMGITRIAKESLFSGMNNLAVCSVMSEKYSRVFGFTREEMDDILLEYGLTDQKDLVRFWYDGFTFGGVTEIYNPWSVINYLSHRNSPPSDYWSQSGGLGLVDHLLKKGGSALKEGFETLLGGGTIEKPVREDLIFPQLDGDENAVWSLLIAAGYLKPVPPIAAGTAIAAGTTAQGPLRQKTRLILTNYETKRALCDMVADWFETPSGNHMERFAQALVRGDLWEMNDSMQQVLLQSVSAFDSGVKPAGGSVRPENFFHGLTLGMLTCLSGDYLVTSNRESGFGRYDVSIEPVRREESRRAAIMEFKVFSEKEGDRTLEDTAGRALRQIVDKGYDSELIARGFPAEEIRRYGFGFRGKEVKIIK